MWNYDFLVSSATANEIVAIAAALEEAEVLCTVVSNTGTGVIIRIIWSSSQCLPN